MVAKDMDILEVGRAVLEPEADKVTDIGGEPRRSSMARAAV